MTAPAPGNQVDHIVYSWAETNLLGARGYGPIDTSLAEDGDLQFIDRALGNYMRAADGQGAARPPRSICLVRGREWSAVLHRSRNESFDRHDVGHALVGGRDVFTASVALSVADWPGWRTDHLQRGDFATLTSSILADRLVTSATDLDKRAAQQAGPVAVALSALLPDPGGKHGVLIPERVAPAETVSTLWAVQRILAALATGLVNVRPFATFSTYAPGLAASVYAGLDLICAPEIGASGSFELTRVVARPYAPGVVPDPVAETLAEEYFEGGLEGLEGFLHDRGVYRRATLGERLECLSVSRIGTPATKPPRPAPPPRPEPAQRTVTVPRPSGPSLEEVLALVDAHPLVLLDNLTTLEQLTAQLDDQGRARYCRALTERRFHLRQLRRRLKRFQVDRVLRTLVITAIGPAPDQLPKRAWQALLDVSVPDEAVAIACDYSGAHGVWTPLLPWLELRYLRRNGLPGAEQRVSWRESLATLVQAPLGIMLLIGLTVGIAFGAWLTR
jgi:hypothetical protein